ncbi:hypothetical protein [Sandaracinobacteroides hominis]|uniref:hypothetical protein n=1 Tax=Sandaracinobacteroides hominis TaxID=2780086 RepID=UPI0018F6A2CB|nr:hypothetical protein [Sandaracinobacteroides hominis]
MTNAIELTGAVAGNDGETLRKAAAGFEALMLEKILAAARPESGGPMADARSIADQALAADLSKSNPFGLQQLLGGKS